MNLRAYSREKGHEGARIGYLREVIAVSSALVIPSRIDLLY